jgi:hypothetical protein
LEEDIQTGMLVLLSILSRHINDIVPVETTCTSMFCTGVNYVQHTFYLTSNPFLVVGVLPILTSTGMLNPFNPPFFSLSRSDLIDAQFQPSLIDP